MKHIYFIIRKATNEIIFASTEYDIMKQYVIKHFPNYTIYEKCKVIIIHSNNFTFNKIEMNYDIYENEYYE